jgi:hypothetical protein
MTSTRALDYVPLDSIQTADRNPKGHEHVALRSSFDRFGFVEPMVRDDRTGRLVAGHGRLAELRQARARDPLTPPSGVVLEDGQWHVPIITGWSSSDDAEAEAYLIAANRLVELGGWDDATLTDALMSLADAGEEMLAGVGYSYEDALGMLSKQLGDETDGGDDDTSPKLEGLTYRVIVDCDGEEHQAMVLAELDQLGLKVRAIVN